MASPPRLDQWLEDLGAHRRLALDTNAVIYALEEVEPYRELAWRLLWLMERGLILVVLSTVVMAEVLVKPLREQNQVAIEKTGLFFRDSPQLVVRNVDWAIARRAAFVRAVDRLSLPDAMIVATAIEERCGAIVGNDGDLARRVRGIPYLCMDSYIS